MGRHQRAWLYIGACSRLVTSLRLHEGLVPTRLAPTYSRDSGSGSLRKACCQRFVCLVWVLDTVLASFTGQAPSLRESDLSVAATSFTPSDETTSAFMELARAAGICSKVLNHNRMVKADVIDSLRASFRDCEDGLNRWAQSLSPRHVFNDANLSVVTRALQDSDTHAESSTAWCWTMM